MTRLCRLFAFCAAVSLTLVSMALADAPADSVVAAPQVGVTADPCKDVPSEPTAAHKAAANPWAAWMQDWLKLDWAQRCRYHAENSALPAAASTRVIFLGDSITEAWKNLDPDFFVHDTLDRGISGQTTEQMLLRLRPDVLELHPAVLHIMAGTNDIAGNVGPTTLALIQGNIQSMVELARVQGIAVILASVPPAARFGWRPELQPAATIAALNTWLREFAAREHLIYADYYAVLADGQGGLLAALSDDGVHPNAAGYAAMKPIAQAAVARALAGHRHGARGLR